MSKTDKDRKHGLMITCFEKSKRSRIGIEIVLLICCLAGSMMFVNIASAASLPLISVNVSSGVAVGTNVLSLGFNPQLDWWNFRDSAHQQQLAKDANFKMVQIWDRNMGSRDYSKGVGPCTYWNEATKTGKFDWTVVDAFARLVFSIGAQPIILLCSPSVFPPGMAIDPNTQLPYPQSFAAYAAIWVQHFKDVRLPVSYYEIFGEPEAYFGWAPPGDVQKVANFVNIFNAAYTKMHQVDPNVMVSTDTSLERLFFSYFLDHGVGIDFLDFHKYDAWKYPQYSDAQMLAEAEQKYFDSTSYDYTAYSIAEARQAWSSKHGGNQLPAILSEGNFNAACNDGTDPRVQQMVGAVRTALVARAGMLNGLNYDLYYCFATSLRYWQALPTGGAGFGMINEDNEAPWYQYYVLQMIGTNLSPNDRIIQSSVSDNTNFRTIAWQHNGHTNLLIINRSTQSYQVQINGLQGTVSYSKIDQSISWKSPQVQKGQLVTSLPCTGYTVALIQDDASLPPPPPPSSTIFQDGFESGSFSGYTGTRTSSGETATIVNTRSHQGTYSAKLSSNGDGGMWEYASCYKTVALHSELYARGYFYVSQSGASQNDDRFYFIMFSSGTGNVAYAGWRNTGGAVKWTLLIKSGTNIVIAFSTSTLSLNHWYSVELHWKEDAVNGLAELWIDGAKVCSITGQDTTAYGEITSVSFGLPAIFYCGPTTVYCDDCVISTASIGTS